MAQQQQQYKLPFEVRLLVLFRWLMRSRWCRLISSWLCVRCLCRYSIVQSMLPYGYVLVMTWFNGLSLPTLLP